MIVRPKWMKGFASTNNQFVSDAEGMLSCITGTTIRVPIELRARVWQNAQRNQISHAAVLERALDLLDRETFFAQLHHDVSQYPEDEPQRRERESWLAGSD